MNNEAVINSHKAVDNYGYQYYNYEIQMPHPLRQNQETIKFY